MATASESNGKKKVREILGYVFLVVVAFGLVITVVWGVWLYFGGVPIEKYAGEEGALVKAAQYGDSFGYVNSLLTGLALATATVAIILQTAELRLQRVELQESQRTWRDTADAQRDSHAALKEQAELMEKQSRFMLLAAYLNAVSGILQDREANADLINSARATMGQTLTSLKGEIEDILGGPAKSPSPTEALKRDIAKIINVLELHGPLLNKLGETDSLLPVVLQALKKSRDDYAAVANRVPAGLQPLATDGIQSFCEFVDLVARARRGTKPEIANCLSEMPLKYSALLSLLHSLDGSIR